MLTVSFDKHSMRFCSSFLQMVTKNQCCPQIVVSRHKIRHVQHYYKLCCCMKLILLWVENLCQMSEQGNGVNGAVWRQLQLWPIGKFRFRIYIPGDYTNSYRIYLIVFYRKWKNLWKFAAGNVYWFYYKRCSKCSLFSTTTLLAFKE